MQSKLSEKMDCEEEEDLFEEIYYCFIATLCTCYLFSYYTNSEELGSHEIDRQTLGADSCTSRFIAVSACIFSYGIAKAKRLSKWYYIADDLFVLLMRGNGLNPNFMFDDQNLIKESIRSETIEKELPCKEWTKEAIPKIVLGKMANQQLQNLLMEPQRHSALVAWNS